MGRDRVNNHPTADYMRNHGLPLGLVPRDANFLLSSDASGRDGRDFSDPASGRRTRSGLDITLREGKRRS